MDTKIVDVTIHIDETIDHTARESVRDQLLALNGVMAAVSHDERPHLMVVEYDPDRMSSQTILAQVRNSGVHAELIGL